MYVISLSYKVPLDTIIEHRPAHLEWLQIHYDSGLFIASGRKNPPNGGVIISKAIEREVLEKILQSDPFSLNDLADYEIIEFDAIMTCPELKNAAE